MSDAPRADPEEPDGPEAEEVARLSADGMWRGDAASRGLGMELVEIGPGYAIMAMTITPAMTNGHDTAHGGFIFALADSAFAFACNSRGDKAVAQHCSISYLRPGRRGDRLVASAHEVAREGRTGLYDVNVSVEGETIAEFRGHSRTVRGRWVE